MELRQIRYFQRVATLLSFTKAARSLHITQPPLSRQIKLLEEELGLTLFERAGRGICLTEAGRYFFDQTGHITQKLEEIVKATQRIGRKERRWFGLGFVPSVLYGYMPHFIRKLRVLDTQVEIGLIEMTTLQQFDALKAGRIDIGLGRILLNDPEIARLVLADEKLVVALSSDHPLSMRESLSLDETVLQPLVLYPAKPRPSYADHVTDLFTKAGYTLNIVQEVNELQTAIGLVAAGVGAAIVPASVRSLHRPDVAYVALDAAGFTSPVMLSWRERDDSDFLRAAINLARDVESEFQLP